MLKIICGGQTGVDRAALDAAIELGIAYDGWCPKGRLDEDGIIPDRYSLSEISGEFENDKENYDARTKLNIQCSNATLIIVPKIPLPIEIEDGTLLTLDEVKKQNKPYIILDLTKSYEHNLKSLIKWINNLNIEVLNIAGPRESSWKDIYQSSFNMLMFLLPKLEHIVNSRNINRPN